MRKTSVYIFILSLVFLSSSLAIEIPGDPIRGKLLFQQNCAVCHSIGLKDQAISGVGPLLAGIYGKPAGSLTDYSYTKQLKHSGIVWAYKTLNKFLIAPMAYVPGTAMAIQIADQNDRDSIIAYIASLKEPEDLVARMRMKYPKIKTLGDYNNDSPGAIHRINLDQLPKPYTTRSSGNSPKIVSRPQSAVLSVPKGFKVELYSVKLDRPRLLRTAPNGDIFISETKGGKIKVLRTIDGSNTPASISLFTENLKGPFGIAFYPLGSNPQWVYVATLNSVVRFPYHNGDLKTDASPEVIVPKLSNDTGGHSTRDIAFSQDGKTLLISVGSGSNVADFMDKKSPDELIDWNSSHAYGSTWGSEENRADVLMTDPLGKAPLRPYATGIRNGVSIVTQPTTGLLWVATNERDALGDDLVPDYVTHIEKGGFYGWPWYYWGNNEDPRHAGERPDLKNNIVVPDLPLQSHSAALQMTFYPDSISGVSTFPDNYKGDIFVCSHGSWNRTGRTGSKLIRIHLKDGKTIGYYEDFLTGFVVDDGHVWGRPVGVTVAHDGSILMSEDANNTVWRISTVSL